MKRLIPFFLVGLIACQNESKTDSSADDQAKSYSTKVMEYAVDLNSVFHQDLNDEDFSDVSTITENLIADVISGKLPAYDRMSDEPLSVDEVKTLLQFTDTIYFFDNETGEVASMEVVERNYTKEFYGFTFREQWWYDQDGRIIEKKILGIAPRIPVYSKQEGILRGYTSAFWVKYD